MTSHEATETDRTMQVDAIARAAAACGMTRAAFVVAAWAPLAAAERVEVARVAAMRPRERTRHLRETYGRMAPHVGRELAAAAKRARSTRSAPPAPRPAARPRAARPRTTTTHASTTPARAGDAPPAPPTRRPWLLDPWDADDEQLTRSGWRPDGDAWIDPHPRSGEPRRCSITRAMAREWMRRRAQLRLPPLVRVLVGGGA